VAEKIPVQLPQILARNSVSYGTAVIFEFFGRKTLRDIFEFFFHFIGEKKVGEFLYFLRAILI
jgi:hypothetical protein